MFWLFSEVRMSLVSPRSRQICEDRRKLSWGLHGSRVNASLGFDIGMIKDVLENWEFLRKIFLSHFYFFFSYSVFQIRKTVTKFCHWPSIFILWISSFLYQIWLPKFWYRLYLMIFSGNNTQSQQQVKKFVVFHSYGAGLKEF